MRLLLADDDPVVLIGLAELLCQQSGIEVVGAVKDGEQAVEFCAAHAVDVALLDVDMPIVDGVEAAKQILQRTPSVVVVMLTAFAHDEFLGRALAAGARGFLTKDLSAERIAELLRDAVAGQVVMGPKPLQMLVTAYGARAVDSEARQEFARAAETLPVRLREVFDLLAQGLPNRVIARRLGLTESTTRVYVSKVLAHTGCRSRSEVAVKALGSGLG
ncbi:response regulator transcription factor [Luteococcus sp. H138]|uniref:response regulator transcription factor n=1 Tax=unclassified Luteococcus TaxID=2639923 RepID=UPI00313ACC91